MHAERLDPRRDAPGRQRCVLRCALRRFVVAVPSASEAKGSRPSPDFSAEGDAFFAFGADCPRSVVAGNILRGDLHTYPYTAEEFFVCANRIGLREGSFCVEFRKKLLGSLVTALASGNANSAAVRQI